MRKVRLFNKETNDLEQWVSEELNPFLDELNRLLDRQASFDRLFMSFTEEVEITSGATKTIVNRLPVIPDEWVTADVDGAGAGPLERGSTDWTRQLLYIKNTGATGTFKIRFFSNGRR